MKRRGVPVKPKTHPFQPDTTATHWDGEQTCASCTLRKGNRVHQVPEQSDDAKRIDRRRVGERDETA